MDSSAEVPTGRHDAAALKGTSGQVLLERSAVVSDDDRPRPRSVRPRRDDLQALAVVLFAVLLWVVGLRGADPRAMTDLGLISLFTVPMVAALAVLTVGFFVALARKASEWVLAAHLVAFIGLIHGTPPALFKTLRYGWAWKHVGIVDYILRTGRVDTTISSRPVYHSWPGFFGGDALLTELTGRSSLLPLATWTQLALNVFDLLAARFLIRSLTDDRRVVWLALWLFFVTSWVGQDYFSPQGMVFPLYMVLMGLVLRAHRPARVASDDAGRPVSTVMSVRAALPIMVLVMGVIASSHQITPLMMVLALTTVFALRQGRGWYVPVVAAVLTVGWALVVARGYTLNNLGGLTIGHPVQNGVDTFEKSADVRGGQVLVAYGGRFTTAVGLAVALVGVYRVWWRRRLDRAALLLLLSPLLLLAVTEYGGEVLFRVVLFTSPFMAYFAALAIYPNAAERARTRRAVTGAALTAVLLPGFLLGYYGKDAQNYFTPAEVRAVNWLYENADPNTVIVEGSRNYPQRFRNYENFVLLSIANEPKDSRDRVLADPAGRLARWLRAGPSDKPAYVLITRGQKVANDLIGPMPVGSLERIEQALRASPRFRVVLSTGDAVVFTLAENGGQAR
jgi:ABC-type amino acid transport system permease subunit